MGKKKLIIKGKVKELSFEELMEEYKSAIKSITKKYNFLTNLNDVSEEDVYQMVVIGLYKAYEKYDIKYEKEFSAIAFLNMKSLCFRKYRSETHTFTVDFYKHNKSLSETLYKVTKGEDITYEDSLEDEFNIEESVLNKTLLSEAINLIKTKLSERDSKIVLNLITKNKVQRELAEELNITQVQVSRYYNKSLKYIKACVGEV